MRKNQRGRFRRLVLKPLRGASSKRLTFIFARVGEHQTAVITFLLEVAEPPAHLAQAEVLFEQRVAVEGGEVLLEGVLETTMMMMMMFAKQIQHCRT